MPVSSIQLSIALITRNGPERLERCLKSVRAQSVQPCEIVVSDDSTPEFTEPTQVVSERYNCRYIPGPRRGLYANRNASLAACRGTHFRTMDDDHILPEGHLALCLNSVVSDPEAIWTTGETPVIDGIPVMVTALANQLHPSGLGCWPENPDDNWTIADGSTIYPASVFERGFRMFEEWSYGSSYLEFGALLYHNGYKSRCIPEAMVEHHADKQTLVRQTTYEQKKAESHIFASLAYTLFFKPSLIKATKYTLASFASSRYQIRLMTRVPVILRAVYERWKAPTAKSTLKL